MEAVMLQNVLRALLGPTNPDEVPESEESTKAEDVLASAKLAIEEIRRQLDQQAKAAESVDTKGAAILTLTGTVAGLIATKVHFDSDIRAVAGGISFLIVLGILGCCIQAVRPRKGFSYGADARTLVDLVDAYSHLQVSLAVADSLRDARAMNVLHLETKQSWLQNALILIVLAVAAVAFLVRLEAIR